MRKSGFSTRNASSVVSINTERDHTAATPGREPSIEIKTKTLPPPSQPWFERKLTSTLLQRVKVSRVTVVQAPTGYGKSLLLRQWWDMLPAEARRAWLTADSHDRRPSSFRAYLAAAMGKPLAHSEFANLVDTLIGDGTPFFVFIDDAHYLSLPARRVLSRLIEYAPANTHFIIATQQRLELDLERYLLRGNITEFGIPELRLDGDTSAAFMATRGSDRLDPARLSMMLYLSDGWIAGLTMVGDALVNMADATSADATLLRTRKALYRSFEHVLASADADLREFLESICLLDRLSPALCAVVTERNDSAEMLARLCAAGQFLLLDERQDGWYRFHRLFADFMRARSNGEAKRSASHISASRWFAQQGMFQDSLAHAQLSGDQTFLADILEAQSEGHINAGNAQIVAQFAADLPESLLKQYPRILMTIAWLRTRNLRFGDARRLLEIVHQRLAEMTASGEPVDDVAHLQLMLAHREAMVAAGQDNMADVEQQCRALIKQFGDNDPYLLCTLHAQLLWSQREQLNLTALDSMRATAEAILRRSGCAAAAVTLQAVAGPALVAAGKTEAARVAFESGLAEAINIAGERSEVAALVALPYSDLLYEWNQLDAAEELIRNHLPVARSLGFVDQLIAGYVGQARLRLAAKDSVGATQILEEGLAVALECGLDRLRLSLLNERVRMFMRGAQPERARALARTGGIPAASVELLPTAGSTTRDELIAMIWMRTAIGRTNASNEARTLGQRWRAFCAKRGAVRAMVRWGLLLVQVEVLSGRTLAAQRILRETLRDAARGNLIRSFVDEGPSILQLMRVEYAGAKAAGDSTEPFARAVIAAFDGKSIAESAQPDADVQDGGLYGTLSERELEILALVGSGLHNKEIGDRLGLTEGSVKWTLQLIYDKLGIRRRFQAVDKARQFGLIPSLIAG